MTGITLGREEFADRVYGCWLGKNIGGTLGCNLEGKKVVHDLTFYDPVPEEPAPNDDLDLQLVWLKMLEDKGAEPPTLSDFADYWLKYLRAYPPDEYGFCLRNLERGLRPPISGCFQNRDVDCMGAPIRSEIWACIAPANPQLAASLAFRDATLDHAGGEGVNGEMFWAAVESAAFVIQDPLELIRIGLSMIPLHSHIARAVSCVVWSYEHGDSWDEAREKATQRFSNPVRNPGYGHPCLAAPNHAFTVIGWLYGRDFGDRLCKAVNCGYDTDCTGATLGALLGILGGPSHIPDAWRRPVGETIVLHRFTGDCDPPRDVQELTQRTLRIAEVFTKRHSPRVALQDRKAIPEDAISILGRGDLAHRVRAECDTHSAVANVGEVEIALHYNGEPVLYASREKVVSISARRDGRQMEDLDVTLTGPADWRIAPEGDGSFAIRCEREVAGSDLHVRAVVDGREYVADFRMLGLRDVEGVDAYMNVPICPECRARAAACLCSRVVATTAP